MIREQERKLGFRELTAFFCLTAGIKYIDMTSIMFYQDTLNAGWMIPILISVFLVVPYITLLSLLKEYNCGFVDVIFKVTGRQIGFFLTFTLFIYVVIATTLNAASYTHILHTMFMPRTPLFVIHALGLFTCYFAATKGLKVLGYTSWLVFFVVKFFTILFILFGIQFVLKDSDVRNIFPIFGPGPMKLLAVVPENATIFADFFYISVFYGYFKSHKEYIKGSIIGWLVVLAELTIIFALFAIAFYYPSLIKLQVPFHQLAMNIGIGRYISNIELFFLGYWIIAAVMRFALYLYTGAAVLGGCLGIKEFEPLLLPLTFLIYLLGLIPNNEIEIIFHLRKNFLYQTGWVSIAILPILLWIVSKIRGGNKIEQTKDKI